MNRFRLQPSEVECGAAIICFVLALLLAFHETLGFSAGPALLPVLVLAGTAVIFAWLLRLVLLLARWKRRRRAFREHKVSWLLLPVLSLLLAAGWLGRDWIANRPLPFDGARWRRVVRGGGDHARMRMLDALRSKRLRPGLERRAVLVLLGPQDEPAWSAPVVYWWLQPADRSSRSFYLAARFDAEDRLVETWLEVH